MVEFEKIDENTFVYRNPKYNGPQVQNAIPSKECVEYHKNSFVQFIISQELYDKFKEKKE